MEGVSWTVNSTLSVQLKFDTLSKVENTPTHSLCWVSNTMWLSEDSFWQTRGDMMHYSLWNKGAKIPLTIFASTCSGPSSWAGTIKKRQGSQDRNLVIWMNLFLELEREVWVDYTQPIRALITDRLICAIFDLATRTRQKLSCNIWSL